MAKSWLEIVFPVGLALLVCTMGIFLLTMAGLLTSEPVEVEEITPVACGVRAENPVALQTPPGATAADVAAGDALFKGNCAQCHAINDVVVGPALAGITKRRPVSWLIPWIKNSSKVVTSGDEYAVKIFNQFQKQQMPSFRLSDQEVKQILAYVEAQQGSPVN